MNRQPDNETEGLVYVAQMINELNLGLQKKDYLGEKMIADDIKTSVRNLINSNTKLEKSNAIHNSAIRWLTGIVAITAVLDLLFFIASTK
jgi:hypothetical protein